MPHQCPADLLISSNVIYIPLVSYFPRTSNHQGASSLSLPSFVCVLGGYPHRLHHPNYHVCWPKETQAGSWKEKGVRCTSFCLPLFHSCFFSALTELPIVELLNWMQFCLQALFHHPRFISPSAPGAVMLPTFASIWVSLHHMLLSPNPAVTTGSSFSKASLFWLSWSLDHRILIVIEKFHWI